MSNTWARDIWEMHQHYGVHEWVAENKEPSTLDALLRFRVDFIDEERRELELAMNAGDAEEVVDALIDLCVVAIGTLDVMGVDVQRAWEEVHRANMAKEVGVKESRPNPLGLPDLVKPDGWEGPSHRNNHGLLPAALEDRPHPVVTIDGVEIAADIARGVPESPGIW